MLCIIFMVALSTGIYSAMNMALDCMEDRYYNYLDVSLSELKDLRTLLNSEEFKKLIGEE